MMKKIKNILLIFICFFCFINVTKAESLKTLKDKLEKDIAEQNANIAKQKEVQEKMNDASDEISDLENDIEDYQEKIEVARNEIDELEEEIENKKLEINNLISFKQVADEDNVYLEYIFNAKSFSDFIYRSSVVEQLTKYNDELIDDMNEMIEKDKKLQEKLSKMITTSESKVTDLESKLKKYNISMSDLEKVHTDIVAEIKERKETIAYYEKVYKQNNCKETVDLVTCITNTPNSTGFVRPTKKGYISSDYGYRICPFHGKEFHNGIDIALALGNNVYAAANGTVSGITKKSSCGGNIVTINHSINGKKYRTIYMHLATIKVKVGDVVTINTVIGTVGGGGYTIKSNGGWDRCSTGAHLHFTIKSGWTGSTSVSPRNFIKFPAKGKSFSSRW